MLTVLLAFAERGNVSKSNLLYFGTFILDIMLINMLWDVLGVEYD